jgi:hypothetical protein
MKKLGIAYNVFEVDDLLEASLRCMRPLAAYIVVVYQVRHYTGQPIASEHLKRLKALKACQLVDELVLFKGSPKQSWIRQERTKRNMGLFAVARAACSHYLAMDAAEFYLPEAFEKAKVLLSSENYDSSVCVIREYFKYPTVQLCLPVQAEGSSTALSTLRYVPFISKLPVKESVTRQTLEAGFFMWGMYGHGKQKRYPVPSNPIRQLPFKRVKVFQPDTLEMHCMAWVHPSRNHWHPHVSASPHVQAYQKYYEAWEPPQPIITWEQFKVVSDEVPMHDTLSLPMTGFETYPYVIMPHDPFGITLPHA